MEEFHFLGRGLQDARDHRVIEKEMNPIHTLGEEVFYLVEVCFADSDFFHILRVLLNLCMGKGKSPKFDEQDPTGYPIYGGSTFVRLGLRQAKSCIL